MENKLIIPAILSRYSPRADKSWSVTLNLNEPNAEQKVIIDRMHQQAIVILMKDTGITKDDEFIIDKVDGDIENKTPSQRLRGIFYRLWQQNPEGYTDFKEYYKYKMESIITHFKNKIE
jgi:hypothetical protein